MAATRIGDIVLNLNLPRDMQTVMVHSITDKIIIGIVIGTPARQLVFWRIHSGKEKPEQKRWEPQERKHRSRPELDASPRAVEASSITAHQSYISLETAELSMRRRGLTER